MEETIPYESQRRTMVEQQLRRRGISDERVLGAMWKVPRHAFVAALYVEAAYEDRPLSIGFAQTISQPYIVAAMTQAAAVLPGDRVLEVGTGTGYQAAILAELGARVYTVERNVRLAEAARARLRRLGYTDVEVVVGDGSEGYIPAAPYQVILVTAAAPAVPESLLDQLADGGRLLIPVGDLRQQGLYLLLKQGNEIKQEILDSCQFVPLVGKHGWPESTYLENLTSKS